MLTLLSIQGLGQADPKGTSKKATENRDDDYVASGLDILRVIKPWAAVVDVLVVHERTRKGSCAAVWRVWYAMSTLFLGLRLFLLTLGLGADLRHGLDVTGRLRDAALLQNLAPVHQP